ncbi:MAG TPA: serine hydrolase domain-containing protein [Anaeromyxobacter sp.]|nr:serine hydrolase domain-containing protein [Anaeromyxobacter sp.]
MRIALAAAALVLAGAPPPRPVEDGPFRPGDLIVSEGELARGCADRAAEELRFRGVVRIEHDGELLVEKGYGGRDPATAFWVASVSKSFTAVLVLRLQEQGKLRLEDPIARHLPDAPAAAREITVDDLLKHTSGLPRSTYEAEGIADAREATRRILALPRGERGKFAYTNDGYALLAIVAEKAGGAPFQDLLRREVLDRARLAHTGFWPGCAKGTPVAKLARPPTGARAGETWGSKGGEGICATAGDLARFLRAVADGTLVAPASRDLLWAHAVPTSAGSAGRGFFVSRSVRGEPVVWTRGTEERGHNAVVRWYPESRVLVAVASDVAEPRAEVPAPSRAMGDLLEERLPRFP